MPEVASIVYALYSDFLERGIRYFFPEADLEVKSRKAKPTPVLRFDTATDGRLRLDWMSNRYLLSLKRGPFTENQVRLLGAIGAVLAARFRSIYRADSAAATTGLFEGLPEDRYVSAFLRLGPYIDSETCPRAPMWSPMPLK